MGNVNPTATQIEALAAGDMDAPIAMINLLRFREQAEYAEDFEADPCTGHEAYGRYTEGALVALAKIGARPIWSAQAHQVAIGPEDESWDRAFIVHYPSLARFLEMIGDPDYQAFVPHRTAALADSRLIRCDGSEDGLELPAG